MKVIDASNCIYGRLSTIIAKELLNTDEKIVVVNAADTVVTGSRKYVLKRFLSRRDIGSVRKGPYYPRVPKAILKRSIGEMLPKKTTRGKEALRRCIVYDGVPSEYRDVEKVILDKAKNTKVSGYVTLAEVARIMGREVKVVE
ncbi:MAG: 50S ribosomal protein L13 [Candidatus Thermoplasmatota archaeon]|jgi:large subunit ribosomal protein L13|nr:50S ribosomal protein L13 [Candidatus Thermoplasmatota archaeon]